MDQNKRTLEYTLSTTRKIEKLFPRDFEYFNPKRYDVPSNYVTPKVVATGMVHLARSLQKDYTDAKNKGEPFFDISSENTIMFSCSAECCRWKFPIFFLSPALLEKFKLCNLPTDVDFTSLKWPFTGFSVMFPIDGSSLNFGNCRTLYLSMALSEANAKVDDSFPYTFARDFIHNEDKARVSFVAGFEDGTRSTISCSYEANLLNQLENAKVDTTNCGKEAEQDFNRFKIISARVAVQILLLFNARPELFNAPQLVPQKEARKGKARRVELYAPNYVGDASHSKSIYAPRNGEESGVKLAGHWKRGHWKNHACGKGRLERKVIWIEPYWAGEVS